MTKKAITPKDPQAKAAKTADDKTTAERKTSVIKAHRKSSLIKGH